MILCQLLYPDRVWSLHTSTNQVHSAEPVIHYLTPSETIHLMLSFDDVCTSIPNLASLPLRFQIYKVNILKDFCFFVFSIHHVINVYVFLFTFLAFNYYQNEVYVTCSTMKCLCFCAVSGCNSILVCSWSFYFIITSFRILRTQDFAWWFCCLSAF